MASYKSRTKLSNKIKVLFVAEIGGKWDAMDSLFHAFMKRDDCYVEIVTEPVFRRRVLEDGSVRKEVICDDWLKSLGAKYYNYEDYDMAIDRPDITFISQPYESVTIPMFWPENISKYSQLVYVPYYTAVTMNYGVTFKAFIKMPVEQYAWKIVCQSDNLKKYYEKYASNHGKNIIVTGLPKWDYPMMASRKLVECPSKWKEKIANKKVILLNTHFRTVPDMINTGLVNEIIEKCALRNDVALIWRPHPLTDAFVKVNCPECYFEYCKMKETVANSSNMIIDDYESYLFSFAWSDILVTPCESSLIEQYILMGKQVLCTSIFPDENQSFDLFDFNKIPYVSTSDEIFKYINSLTDKENIEYLRSTYFAKSDGHIGERVADVVMSEFYSGSTTER